MKTNALALDQYSFKVISTEFEPGLKRGEQIQLSKFAHRVLVVVNVASRCGLTPQYEGLEALYRKFRDRGLLILGFPCNQFGAQEPGSDEEIQSFCSAKYEVSFPILEKIDVNGDSAHPLYQALKQKAPGVLGSEMIKWNFTKFLLNKEGEVIERFAPTTEPKDLEKSILELL